MYSRMERQESLSKYMDTNIVTRVRDPYLTGEILWRARQDLCQIECEHHRMAELVIGVFLTLSHFSIRQKGSLMVRPNQNKHQLAILLQQNLVLFYPVLSQHHTPPLSFQCQQ